MSGKSAEANKANLLLLSPTKDKPGDLHQYFIACVGDCDREIGRRYGPTQWQPLETALSYLTAIALTPIAEVAASSSLCQSFQEATTPDGGTTLKVPIPCKLKALSLLRKWCGWETGTQAERDAAKAMGGVAEMMQRIRARK